MEEPDWENIRGLRVIGWALNHWDLNDNFNPHELALTGRDFEVVGYNVHDLDRTLMLREVGTNSSELYEVHFSWVILG